MLFVTITQYNAGPMRYLRDRYSRNQKGTEDAKATNCFTPYAKMVLAQSPNSESTEGDISHNAIRQPVTTADKTRLRGKQSPVNDTNHVSNESLPIYSGTKIEQSHRAVGVQQKRAYDEKLQENPLHDQTVYNLQSNKLEHTGKNDLNSHSHAAISTASSDVIGNTESTNETMLSEHTEVIQQDCLECVGRLYLSFASFRSYKPTYTTECNLEGDSSQITSCFSTRKYLEQYCVEKFDYQYVKPDFRTDLKLNLYHINDKEQLTGFYRRAFYFTFEDKPQDFFLTFTDIENSEYDKSLISFIETYKNDESVVYQRIQGYYIIFLTHKCLIYDHNAHSYILKPDLWQLHQFWIEFYIYILWKLEEINTNQLDIKVAEEKYKTHLIKEMKAINKILNYYNDLQIAANTSNVSLQCRLFDAIHEFRQEVQSYLETFYKADKLTQFYKSILTISSEIQSVDITVQSNGSEPHLQSTSVVKNGRESSTIDQNSSKNAGNSESNNEHKIKKHQQCLINNTAFLLAFTVDFSGVRNSCFHFIPLQLRKRPVVVQLIMLQLTLIIC